MNIYGTLMKTARKVKHSIRAKTAKPVFISPVRRVGHVALKQRVCAMTFDDGPCLLPPSESRNSDPLTQVIIDILEKYNACGTFDVVGDTSGNYPDKPGRGGTAAWGGVRYDHYPDFASDSDGGALHAGELIERMLSGGHAVANHGYAHILFGPKSVVYGRRAHLHNIGEVLDELKRLHDLIEEKYGYTIKFARPAHYVDAAPDGFTSYDAYAEMDYTYLAADFDGGGWLPLGSYKDEVEAMVSPLRLALSDDPDALCGQIIFQKDGYNMARRTPVADGLPRQLEILRQYGYKVVTVPELVALSPFSDIYEDHPASIAAKSLIDRGISAAYRDNRIAPEKICTRGEFFMMTHGRDAVLNRLRSLHPAGKNEHPYFRAAELAGTGCAAPDGLNIPLSAAVFDEYLARHYGKTSDLSGSALPRGEVLSAMCKIINPRRAV